MAATKIEPTKTQVSKAKTPKGLSIRKQRAILKWISSGKPANKWLQKHEVNNDCLYNQLDQDNAFRRSYARARELQASSMIDDTISIADNVEEDPASRRIRANVRQFAASKIDSARWGDKLQVETTTKISLLSHLEQIINVTPELEEEG